MPDYDCKKLLAAKALQHKPAGEPRTPNPGLVWSGLEFSSFIPESVIREKFHQEQIVARHGGYERTSIWGVHTGKEEVSEKGIKREKLRKEKEKMDETEVMGRMEQNGTKGNNLLKIPATTPKFDTFYDRSSFNSVVCTTGYFNYKTQDEWLDDNCKIKPNIKFHADKLKIPAIDNSVTEYIVCSSGCFDYETQVKWLDDISRSRPT